MNFKQVSYSPAVTPVYLFYTAFISAGVTLTPADKTWCHLCWFSWNQSIQTDRGRHWDEYWISSVECLLVTGTVEVHCLPVCLLKVRSL